MKAIFKAENINKSYDNHQALKNVSIEIPKGSIFGLLGPNGAGKTTLIRIINQIIAPDEGNLFFNGRPLLPEDTRNIGYLPEERGLYKKMKVGEQAIYLAQLKGVEKSEAKRLLKDWFDKFDLTPWWSYKVEELSKGMQQKIQFIITVLHKPELLIFDEPFSGFDPINVNLLKDEILNLKKQNTTIIFSTHNMNSVEELCDHIALINKSEKILDGPIDEIKSRFAEKKYSLELTPLLPSSTHNIASETFEIIEQVHLNDSRIRLSVTLKDSASVNEVIADLIRNFSIHSLHEVLPSMNDIFISMVNNHQPN